ncbi:MAG TPA: vitamin B12 dependent-methionine synthase activation domain-containing protein, partial [Thermoanaerobaculia bacterium]
TSAGVGAPMLVGGAALSQKFTDHRIAPAYGGLVAYAEDAMRGLALADRILSGEAARGELAVEADKRRAAIAATARPDEEIPLSAPAVRSPEVEVVAGLSLPETEERVLPALDLGEIWRYLNPHMLYAKHLGLRGSYWRLKEAGDSKLAELEKVIAKVQAAGWLSARAMYRYFPARSEGNTLFLAARGGVEARFAFPRQVAGERLCLADFVRPAERGAHADSVGLFITTAGEGVRARAEQLKTAGEYLLCHALQALAVETAEAAAEWLHARLRAAWGFPDRAETTMLDRFQGRYRGKRYSFGYPACPELADQATLFELLDGRKIGVALTEGFMMDPEASVSALVLHHPQARYFAT